jgi:hypothetical protein
MADAAFLKSPAFAPAQRDAYDTLAALQLKSGRGE